MAIFLDYDGTVREFVPDPAAAAPTPPVRDLFDALARDGRVDVTVISGRTPADLERFIAGYPFGLIAEHGATLRPPRSDAWETLDGNESYPWKAEVGRIFRAYAESTPGSLVEEKRTSLVWHYRRADPQVGDETARRLMQDLGEVAAGGAMNVRLGKKIVEVTPPGINKGAAVRRLLERSPPYALVLVAGDDVSDESMFRLNLSNFLSIKVGADASAARYFLPSPDDLRRALLRALA